MSNLLGKFTRSVKAEQRGVRIIPCRVDGTGTAAMIEGGISSVTLTDNGTGDYTLTLAEPSKRIAAVTVTPIGAAGDIVATLGTLAVASVQVLGWDGTDGTTAKDMDFHCVIHCFDAEDEV